MKASIIDLNAGINRDSEVTMFLCLVIVDPQRPRVKCSTGLFTVDLNRVFPTFQGSHRTGIVVKGRTASSSVDCGGDLGLVLGEAIGLD